MRSDPAAASGRRTPAPRPALPPRGAFAEALARARAGPRPGRRSGTAAPESASALLDGSALGAGAGLARRRRGADEGQRALGERRAEAEGGGCGPAASGAGAAPDLRDAPNAEAGRAGALWPPGALELLACELRRGDRPSLELALGREVRVTLIRAARGVEVVLEARAGLGLAAEAELPALVAALRDRGVVVARAEVRATPGDRALRGDRAETTHRAETTRGAAARALTPPWGSATTAPLYPGGTVAKW